MVPPPADVRYELGPGHTGLVLSHGTTWHIEVRQHVSPVHLLSVQVSRATSGEQLLDRPITVYMA